MLVAVTLAVYGQSATSTSPDSQMEPRPGEQRIATKWWPLFLLAAVVGLVFVTATSFSGTFHSSVPVTLTSDRSGLVLENGAR